MDNYPPGMTMRQFGRAFQDTEEECRHGNWEPECEECREEALEKRAERVWERRREDF